MGLYEYSKDERQQSSSVFESKWWWSKSDKYVTETVTTYHQLNLKKGRLCPELNVHVQPPGCQFNWVEFLKLSSATPKSNFDLEFSETQNVDRWRRASFLRVNLCALFSPYHLSWIRFNFGEPSLNTSTAPGSISRFIEMISRPLSCQWKWNMMHDDWNRDWCPEIPETLISARNFGAWKIWRCSAFKSFRGQRAGDCETSTSWTSWVAAWTFAANFPTKP